MAAVLLLLRYSRASGSVVEAWVSFERFCAVPLHLGVAARRRLRRRRAVFGFEALVRRPRLQQGPVDGEVLARDVAAQLGLADHRGEELVRDLVLQQALAVLGERGRVERRLVDAHVQEPLEQQVVVEPFAERPLGADRVHRHQHRRLQQRLRRHAAPATGRVHGVEHVVELGQHRVDHDPDPADRMIRRDQVLGAQRRQHRQLRIRCCHAYPQSFRSSDRTRAPSAEFQHPANGSPRRCCPGSSALTVLLTPM